MFGVKVLKKKLLAESYDNKMIYIWESELKGLIQPEVMNLILTKLSLSVL